MGATVGEQDKLLRTFIEPDDYQTVAPGVIGAAPRICYDGLN